MPPRTTRSIPIEEAQRALAHLRARRTVPRNSDEPRREMIDMIRHVARSTPRAGQQHVRDDVVDALTLLEFSRLHVPALPGELDELEAEVAIVARKVAKMSLADLAQHLGLSRQGVDHRIRRQSAASEGLPRSEVADRWRRRTIAWLSKYGFELQLLAVNLVAQRNILDEEDDRELLHALAGFAPHTGINSSWGLPELAAFNRIIDLLGRSPVVFNLNSDHVLVTSLDRGERHLRNFRREVGSPPPPVTRRSKAVHTTDSVSAERGSQYFP
ncbi:hypothetical protein ACFVYA_37745 [Amycolatopsis sp. NPDC058278]|uniref:hypothetical protein n=1 Tax=Amycolatopsis sp. NPDC058278 TaxID=3346417 RepID=UPI0036DE5A88